MTAARATPAGPRARAARGWVCLGFVVLFALAMNFQGSRALWEPDEGRYSLVALEMLRTGDFVTPHLHPLQPHLAKPPLVYWLLAASVWLLGHSEWALRLPNALAFVATAGLVYLLGQRLVPRRPWLPALVYGSLLLPFVAANVITTDTLLTTWETATVLGFVAALGAPRRGAAWAWGLAAWSAAGLAFLTKGPPGLLPLPVVALFVWRTRRDTGRAGLRLLGGLPLGLLVGASWFLVVSRAHPGLAARLLHDEVLDRVAAGGHGRNSEWYGAFVVYLPTLLLGMLPWTGPLVGGLRALFRRRAAGGGDERASCVTLLRIWIALPLAVFVLSQSRLPFYVLPLSVPLALVTAWHLDARDVRFGRGRVLALGTWMIVMIAAKGWAATRVAHDDARHYAHAIEALHAPPFQEIGFVETRPHYGVGLYLDVRIASLRMKKTTPFALGLGVREGLADALRDPGSRLFVVQGDRARTFEKAAARQDLTPVALGEVDGDRVYAVQVR